MVLCDAGIVFTHGIWSERSNEPTLSDRWRPRAVGAVDRLTIGLGAKAPILRCSEASFRK